MELDSGVQVEHRRRRLRAGERCHAVVRPEKLTIGLGQTATQPSVEGLVESSLYLGTSTQLIVQLPGDVRMTVLVPNTDEAERQRLPGGGAKVQLSWAPEHMHVVQGIQDKRSGAAVAAAEVEQRT